MRRPCAGRGDEIIAVAPALSHLSLEESIDQLSARPLATLVGPFSVLLVRISPSVVTVSVPRVRVDCGTSLASGAPMAFIFAAIPRKPPPISAGAETATASWSRLRNWTKGMMKSPCGKVGKMKS
ncbi:MAG: hypothetical protein IPO97_07765 [Sphingomonadales bacterium]|nr:hypothetical protein [Sphingomonadales bacterium]